MQTRICLWQIQFNDAISVEGDVVSFFIHDSKSCKNLGLKPMQELLNKFSILNISARFLITSVPRRTCMGSHERNPVVRKIRERPLHASEKGWWRLGSGTLTSTELPTFVWWTTEHIGIGSRTGTLLGPKAGTNDNAMNSQRERCFISLCRELRMFQPTLDSTSWGGEHKNRAWIWNWRKRTIRWTSVHRIEITPFQSQDISLEIPTWKNKPSPSSHQSRKWPEELLKFPQSKLQSTLLQIGKRTRKPSATCSRYAQCT